MKKLATLVIIAVLALAACTYALGQAQMPNPMVEVESVQAVEQQLNVKMPLPDGAAVSKCYVIDGAIGQVDYNWSSVNYTFRAKAGDAEEDISGMSVDFAMVEEVEFDEVSVTLHLNDGEAGMAQWFAGGASYALVIEENAHEDALIDVLVHVLYG